MDFDVFISYPRQDKATADAACAKLEAEGIRCWIAPRDVPPGTEWPGEIVKAIDRCRAMVIIFSSNTNASKQIHREVQRAFDREVPVVPFRVENVVPVEALAYYLGSVHWLDALTLPLEQHLQKLVAAVKPFVQKKNSGVSELLEERPRQQEAEALQKAEAERTRQEAEARRREEEARKESELARARQQAAVQPENVSRLLQEPRVASEHNGTGTKPFWRRSLQRFFVYFAVCVLFALAVLLLGWPELAFLFLLISPILASVLAILLELAWPETGPAPGQSGKGAKPFRYRALRQAFGLFVVLFFLLLAYTVVSQAFFHGTLPNSSFSDGLADAIFAALIFGIGCEAYDTFFGA